MAIFQLGEKLSGVIRRPPKICDN